MELIVGTRIDFFSRPRQASADGVRDVCQRIPFASALVDDIDCCRSHSAVLALCRPRGRRLLLLPLAPARRRTPWHGPP